MLSPARASTHFAVSFQWGCDLSSGQGCLPYHLPRMHMVCTQCFSALNNIFFRFQKCLTLNEKLHGHFPFKDPLLTKLEVPGVVWIGKGSPSCEGHSWSTWPTEGAPTPCNTGDSGIWTGPGRRWPADLSPGCSRVARAAEVSAENGHSLGRRGEGGRLGHPKGRKSWQGKHRQTFRRDRDTRKHTAYVHCPYKQQMQYTLHGHRMQLEIFFFFLNHRMQDHGMNAIHYTQIHTTRSSHPAKQQQRQHTDKHTHM